MSNDDHLLTREEVAGRCGWSTARTVSRYLAWSRQKAADGEPLGPHDFPLPTKMFGRTPGWSEEVIDLFLHSRPGRGRSPAQDSTYLADQPATALREGDTMWIDGQRFIVREARQGNPTVRVRVVRSRREAGHWRSLSADSTFSVLRPVH